MADLKETTVCLIHVGHIHTQAPTMCEKHFLLISFHLANYKLLSYRSKNKLYMYIISHHVSGLCLTQLNITNVL